MGSPDDLTDDQVTIVGKKSQIGDGPIYIKKSTDFHTSNRRIKHIESLSSLGGTMNPLKGQRDLASYMAVSKD